MITNVWRGEDVPRYTLGHTVVVSYLAVPLMGESVLNYLLLRIENILRCRGMRQHLADSKSPEEMRLMGDMR